MGREGGVIYPAIIFRVPPPPGVSFKDFLPGEDRESEGEGAAGMWAGRCFA